MDKLMAMRVFAKVAEVGSFRRAAQAMDLSAPVVTRHIADLELMLGVKLLNRTTRSLSLTEQGDLYSQRVLQILADIDETEAVVASNRIAFSGTLKLSVTVNFGLHILPGLLTRFLSTYPRIHIDTILTDEPVDLVVRGRDLGVMYAGTVQASMVTRRLTAAKMILCATPNYLSGRSAPKTPVDLAEHDCIVVTATLCANDLWQLQDNHGMLCSILINPVILCNTAAFAYQCVLADMGIGMFTSYIAQKEIDRGTLVRVLTEYELPDKELVVAYADRKFVSSKVRAFIDFLIDEVHVATSNASD